MLIALFPFHALEKFSTFSTLDIEAVRRVEEDVLPFPPFLAFSPSESLVTMNGCGNTGPSLDQATRYLRHDLLPFELQISNAAVYWITK
jgi:hypothetical protein